MKTRHNINNLQELNAKLLSLKVDYKTQEVMIKADAQHYLQQFTPANLLKKYATPSNLFKADDKLNISSKLMSMLLPILMNSTLFRGSGFITKTIVGLATSKVGKSLDAEHLTGIFNSVKGFFTSKNKKVKDPAFLDYGIPPDSETY